MLFVGEWSEANVRSLSRFLRCLQLVTGLSVNNHKCSILGVGVEETEVDYMARILNCKVGSFPFTYLGIPIGANMNRISHWKPVIDKMSSRLSAWKTKLLSFAGRVTLAKSVLGSLPSYFLSIFKAPKAVINKLEKLRRDFIWGKSGSRNKIRWVRWETLLKAKSLGGYGIGSIRDFNVSMLAKWWWRVRENPSQLWASVVFSIHKTVHERHLIPLNNNLPGVWKYIGSMGSEFLKLGINIMDRLRVVVGDGIGVRFWKDKWVGSSTLKYAFPDLFRMARDKNGSVADHISFRGDIIFWGWAWLKDPSSHQDWIRVGELMRLLHSVNLKDGKDEWSWENNLRVGYSVKNVRMDIEMLRNGNSPVEPFLWNSWALPKANYLLWRSDSGKVASKVALVARGVSANSLLCPRCGLVDEDANHVFVTCLFARSIWWNIFRWVRVSWPQNIVSITGLMEVLANELGSKRWKKMVRMIAMATTWKIWQARNAAVFDNNFIPVRITVESIKDESFVWIRQRAKVSDLTWEEWSSFDVTKFV